MVHRVIAANVVSADISSLISSSGYVRLNKAHGDSFGIKKSVMMLSVFLLAWFSAAVMAEGNALGTWRSKVAYARLLQENNAPAAYKEALRLQAHLPVDVTPRDRAQALNLLARTEVYLALTDKSVAHARQAFNLAKASGDSIGQVESDLTMTLNLINQGKVDQISESVIHSIAVLNGLNRPDLMSEALMQLSMLHRGMGQLDDSASTAMHALDVARRSSNPVALTYAYWGMANSFDLTDHPSEARYYFMLMHGLASIAKMPRLEAMANMGLGRAATHIENLSEGERFMREALKLNREAGMPFAIGLNLFELAENLNKQGRTSAALVQLNEVVAIYHQYPNPMALWRTLSLRGKYNKLLGNDAGASADAERAYQLAKDIGFNSYIGESAQQMAAIAAEHGNHRRAYALAEEAIKMSNSAKSMEASKNILELTKRFEVESKQHQLEDLTRRNAQQAAELRQQRAVYVLASITFVLMSFTMFFLLRLRRSHRNLQQVKDQKQAILEAIPDLLFEVDLDGRYYEAHSMVPELLAAPSEALIGKTVSEVLPEDAAKICLSALQEAHENGLSVGKQMALSLPQGKHWFELSVSRKAVRHGEDAKFIVLSRDISERKKLEEAVRERERHFRNLVESWPDEIARYDVHCRRVYINPHMEKVVGDARLHPSATPTEIYPDSEEVAFFESKLREVLKTGVTQNFERAWSMPAIQPSFRAVRMIAERDDNGVITGVFAVARDITEAKRMETALRDSEQHFRTLAEHLPDQIIRYDQQCRQVYVNHVLDVALGESASDLLGNVSTENNFLPQDESYQNYLNQTMRTGESNEAELKSVNADGKTCYCHVRFVAERDAIGEVVGVLAIRRDITAQRLLQEELIKREQEFRTLVEHSPDVVARYDCDCRYMYCNPQLVAVLGLPRDEIIGKTPLELGDVSQSYHEKIKEVVRTGIEGEFIMLIPTRLGSRKVHDYVRLAPEFNVEGQVVSVLAVGRDISALKDAERHLLTLIENIPDFVMRLDKEGRYLYVSPAVTKAFDLPAEHFMHKTSVELGFTGAFLSDIQLLDSAMTCVREGVPNTLELTIRNAAVNRIFEIMHMPEYDEFGQVETVLAVARDITERYYMEQELIKREREFRTLAEGAPDSISRYDNETRILYINPVLERLGGKAVAEVIGQRVDEIFPQSEAMLRYQKVLEQVIASGKQAEFEMMLKPADGEGHAHYNLIRLAPELDEQGRVVGVVGIGRDVTHIKHIEAMLRKSALEFRTLAENSPEMIVRYDNDFHRIYFNPAYERQSGILLQDTKNKVAESIWKPLLPREEYIAWLKRVMENGHAEHILLEWYGEDGGLVSYHMNAVAEYDEQQNVVGVLAIGHNITEIKATERLLQESQQLLRQLAARSETVREDERKFLAREVHDELGQYLMALHISMTAISLNYGENDPALREEISDLIMLLDNTIQVVRNVVVSLRPKSLDMGLAPALQWLVDEYQRRTETQCTLHILDEAIGLDDVRATAVFRIVQESLTNIARHAQASNVEIVLDKTEDQYVLEVRDNGKGFDPNVRKDKSFGLLGMRERIIMLGGKLEVISEAGQGTVIHVSIPVNFVRSNEE